MNKRVETPRTWWVTSHNDDGTVTKVAGPFTTDDDAAVCRHQLEMRDEVHNYWLEQIEEIEL